MPRRIMLFGLFGQGNLGNDATLLVTLHELRRRLGDVEILCACSGLPPSMAAFDVRPVPLDPLPPKGIWRIGLRPLRYSYSAVAYAATEPWRRRRMLRELTGVDELIVVGTGVLDDFGMLPWDLPAWLLRWTGYAAAVGARVTFLAVGAGPIRNSINRWMMRRAVRYASVRSYRDDVSKAFLTGLGVDTRADQIAPDLVFGISRELLPPNGGPGTPRTIGVGVMGYYGWRNEPSLGQSIYQRYVLKMSQFVCWLIEQGYAVRLLIGESPADQPPVEAITSAVSRFLGTAPPNLTATPIESLDDLFGEIAHCEAVVASRYHNVICALALGRPVIALGYSSKFNALMSDVGLDAYCRNIEEFELQELTDLFAQMMVDRDRLSEFIRQATGRYRSKVTALFDSTFGTAPPRADEVVG